MKKRSAIPRPSPPRPGTEAEADVARDLALLAQRRAQGKSGTYTKEEQLLNQKTAPQGTIGDGFTTPPNSTTPERPEMKDGQPLPAPVCDVEATEVRRTALSLFFHLFPPLYIPEKHHCNNVTYRSLCYLFPRQEYPAMLVALASDPSLPSNIFASTNTEANTNEASSLIFSHIGWKLCRTPHFLYKHMFDRRVLFCCGTNCAPQAPSQYTPTAAAGGSGESPGPECEVRINLLHLQKLWSLNADST